MIINALELAAPTSSWPTSRTRTRRPGRTSSTASSTCCDAVRRTIALRRARDRQGLPPRATGPRRSWCARAAGTSSRSTSLVDGAAGLGRRSSTSALFFFHNARELLARGTGPYFYLPKLESHLEARLWNDVFVLAQAALGHPARHDQGHGADRDDPRRVRDGRDPLRAARALGGPQLRPLGLHLQLHQEVPRATRRCVLPDRAQVTMDAALPARLQPAARSRPATAAARTRWAAWRRRSRSRTTRRATRPRSRRCAPTSCARSRDGHDGTWVAHPGLVAIAREEFDARARPAEPARRARARTCASTRRRPARACPRGTITEAGLRHERRGRRPVPRGLAARASGCVPLYNLMEDAATAEISRAQVWQWIRHGARLDDGRRVDARARRARARRGARDDRARVGARRVRRAAASSAQPRCFERSIARAELRRVPDARAPTTASLPRTCKHRRRTRERHQRALERHSTAPRNGRRTRPGAPLTAGTASAATTRRRTSSACAARVRIEHTLARARRGAALGAAAHARTTCTRSAR